VAKPAAKPRPRPSPTPTPGPPDVYHLRNGDRISGRTVGTSAKAFAVQTPFGRLTIPRPRVAKVVRPDGTEEVLAAADVTPVEPARPAASMPVPAPAPSPGKARLAIAITGKTFWQAWDPKQTDRDPTLRLELRLDEDAVAVFADGQTDPDQIPGAAVNAFSFTGDVASSPAPNVVVHPPEVRPGRIVLKLDVPSTSSSPRRLRLAYQMNTGTPAEPAWKDLASGATEVTLAAGQPALVEVRQDRGRMEFSGFLRRRMKHVETFKLDLTATTSAGAPS
jgi:hypothetical protein